MGLSVFLESIMVLAHGLLRMRNECFLLAIPSLKTTAHHPINFPSVFHQIRLLFSELLAVIRMINVLMSHSAVHVLTKVLWSKANHYFTKSLVLTTATFSSKILIFIWINLWLSSRHIKITRISLLSHYHYHNFLIFTTYTTKQREHAENNMPINIYCFLLWFMPTQWNHNSNSQPLKSIIITLKMSSFMSF